MKRCENFEEMRERCFGERSLKISIADMPEYAENENLSSALFDLKMNVQLLG